MFSDERNYYLDAYGSNITRTEEVQSIRIIEDEFRNLPDNAVVKVGVLKDAICNTCPVGKHCTADNYNSHGMKKVNIYGPIVNHRYQRL